MIRIFDRRLLSAAGGSVVLLTLFYYLFSFLLSTGPSLEAVFLRTLETVASVGAGYQTFFFVQALNSRRKTRTVGNRLDDALPFLPQWVWVYGLMYYVLLGLPVAFLHKTREIHLFIAGGYSILLIAIPIYIFLPTESPASWRSFADTSWSTSFLKGIQRFDNGRACFPSLHCALSAYSATFIPYWPAVIIFPILISLSCVFVKQHSISDIPVSLALGGVCGIIVHIFL